MSPQLSQQIIQMLTQKQEISYARLRQSHSPAVIEEQCDPLIHNGAITLSKDGLLFMTQRQVHNANLIYPTR